MPDSDKFINRPRRLGLRKRAVEADSSGFGAVVHGGDNASRLTEGKADRAAIWRASSDGSITGAWGWNELSDQKQQDYLGEGWLDAVHPDDRARTLASWTAALANGELPPLDYRVRQPDGGYRWASARGMAVRDTSGSIVEWVGTVTDVHESRHSGQVLREREELLRLAVEATGLGIWDMELPSHATTWSPRLKAMAGLPRDAVIDDKTFYDMVHPDDRANVEQLVNDAVGSLNRSPYDLAYRLVRADTKQERWWHEWSRLVTDSTGEPARLVGAIQDITDRKKAEIERHNSEKRWRLALVAGRMLAWEILLESGEMTRSDNADELLGPASGSIVELLGRIHPADRERLRQALENPPRDDSTELELRYNHPDGRQLWLLISMMLIEGDGGPPRIVGISSDITQRKAAEETLRYAASHDALTGVFNRSALHAALDLATQRALAGGGHVELILVDIDHFKEVNDTLGHDAGDHLLRVVADRLCASVGTAGIVARLGGDEFAVLIEGEAAGARIGMLADRLLAELCKGFVHADKLRSVAASLGVASFPAHASLPLDLSKDADLALYAAKAGGRSRVKIFAPEMRRVVEQRATLLGDVKQALALRQFVPFYQPKVDIGTGAVVGFEALARWLHPTRGLLTPQVFGVAFEEGELAIAIGEAMFSAILADMRGWLDRGLDCGRVALNLSTFEFMLPGLADSLLSQLAAARIPPSQFQIEVTETVLLEGEVRGVDATLQRLHRKGASIALDDFGTGYASLAHLKRFPVDELKIDRGFVRNLEGDAGDAAIVSAVINLARGMGLKVVAEGVETLGQMEKLRALGCHHAQGYLFAKPMAGSRVPWFLTHPRQRMSTVGAPAAVSGARPA